MKVKTLGKRAIEKIRRALPPNTELRQAQQFEPVHVLPGDTLELTYRDDDGKEYLVAREEITERQVIDTAIVVKVDGAFGLKTGFGGFFGERAR